MQPDALWEAIVECRSFDDGGQKQRIRIWLEITRRQLATLRTGIEQALIRDVPLVDRLGHKRLGEHFAAAAPGLLHDLESRSDLCAACTLVCIDLGGRHDAFAPCANRVEIDARLWIRRRDSH